MCVLILCETGIPTAAQCRAMRSRNRDGFGLAYGTGSGMALTRDHRMGERKIRKALREAWADPARVGPILAHWRLATAGAVADKNTHPIPVSPDMVLGHNGHICGTPADRGSAWSDTRWLVRWLADVRSLALPLAPQWADALDTWRGSSVVCLLDARGAYSWHGREVTAPWGRASNAQWRPEPTDTGRSSLLWTPEEWDRWCQTRVREVERGFVAPKVPKATKAPEKPIGGSWRDAWLSSPHD